MKDLNTNTEQIAGRYMIMINENKKNDNSTLNNNTGPDRNISVVMFNTNSICEIRHYTSGCIFASRKLCEQENSHFCWNENIYSLNEVWMIFSGISVTHLPHHYTQALELES